MSTENFLVCKQLSTVHTGASESTDIIWQEIPVRTVFLQYATAGLGYHAMLAQPQGHHSSSCEWVNNNCCDGVCIAKVLGTW